MLGESFVGSRLQVAREFRGLAQRELAEQVAASPTLISLLETGKRDRPSPDLIEAFGDILGFAPEFFYRPIEDVFQDHECSFRHRRAASERLKTQIRAHATLIGMVISRLQFVLKFPKLDLPKIHASTSEEIEDAAENARMHWKLDLDAPIHQIARVLEHAGVIIVSHVVQSPTVDAFSRNGRISIIFLNKAIPSTSRWNFDIAHECGHLIMHSGLVTGTVESEAAADRFASAFLLPRKAFSREFRARPFSWEHVFKLKKRWRASAAAIVRRSYNLGLLRAADYRRAYKYISWKAWNTQGEPFEPAFECPNLLEDALGALGKDVDLTLMDLCKELHFSSDAFREITGISVPDQGRPTVVAMNDHNRH
jgi:Zn-dependent peptidase ImmA (M78 family)/DNA-binding XRE family transcriptional regulator